MSDQPYQLLPPLTDDEYTALKADIAERYDPAHPVVVDEDGNVLDGHHRFRACQELGITPPTVVLPGLTHEQKCEYALRANLARRHLTTVQKRALIRAELTRDGTRSDRHLGRLLGVDHKTVAAVRREGGEIPHSERLVADAEQILLLQSDAATEQQEAAAVAGEWVGMWARWVSMWVAFSAVWPEECVQATGCASAWEWMNSGENREAYERFTRNIRAVQQAAAHPFMARYLGVDPDRLGPTPEEFAEVVMDGAQ